MQTETIFATLLAAAAFLKHPIAEVASQSIKDAYEALKAHLRKRFADRPTAVQALDLATDKPESLIRKALLVEESASCGLDYDAELHALVSHLAALLPGPALAIGQHVQVKGQGNCVQVAGRDLVTTAKHVSRNTITPDERHITVEQRRQLQAVIGELAARLSRGDGQPNFGGAHRILQRRFNVASYLLLPREQFPDALAFLKQQRAIHHSPLQRLNPVGYRNDSLRVVFAGARALKWNTEEVRRFAAEVLGLAKLVTSLRELGPVQLRTLAKAVRRRATKARSTVTA